VNDADDALRNIIVRAIMHEYGGKGWDAAYRLTDRLMPIIAQEIKVAKECSGATEPETKVPENAETLT